MCIYSNKWLFMLIFTKCQKLFAYILAVFLKCAKGLVEYLPL